MARFLQGTYAAYLLLSITGLAFYAFDLPVFYALMRSSNQRILFSGPSLGWSLLASASLSFAVLPYLYASRNGRLSMVVSVSSAYPIVALLVGVLFLGEKVSLLQGVGVILTTLGCALVSL